MTEQYSMPVLNLVLIAASIGCIGYLEAFWIHQCCLKRKYAKKKVKKVKKVKKTKRKTSTHVPKWMGTSGSGTDSGPAVPIQRTTLTKSRPSQRKTLTKSMQSQRKTFTKSKSRSKSKSKSNSKSMQQVQRLTADELDEMEHGELAHLNTSDLEEEVSYRKTLTL